MNVIVTGGAGFIGNHLVKKLISKGEHVFCVDNFNTYYNPEIKWINISPIKSNPLFNLIETDIRNKDKLNKMICENKIHAIVHLAALPGVSYSMKEPALYMENNVLGTLDILEYARKYNIAKVILGSSSSVYGNQNKYPVKENAVPSPLSPYAASKTAAEMLCDIYRRNYGISVIKLRFFNVYGPSQRPDMALYKFTDSIVNNKPITVYGDGSSQRDYTYISDIVNGINLTLYAKHTNYDLYNLAYSKPVKLNYLIELIEKYLGKKARIIHVPYKKEDPLITYADNNRIQREFDFTPRVNIDEGVRKFIKWYLDEKT